MKWLIETHRCEVVAFCADLGQGEELDPVEAMRERTGTAGVKLYKGSITVTGRKSPHSLYRPRRQRTYMIGPCRTCDTGICSPA